MEGARILRSLPLSHFGDAGSEENIFIFVLRFQTYGRRPDAIKVTLVAGKLLSPNVKNCI